MYGRQEAQAGRALAVEKAMNMKIKKVKFHKMLQLCANALHCKLNDGIFVEQNKKT